MTPTCLHTGRRDVIRSAVPVNRTNRIGRFRAGFHFPETLMVLAMVGCAVPPQYGRLVNESESLQRENRRLERNIAQRDERLAEMKAQLANLRSLGPNRPVDVFRPVKLEIARLTGGKNYDEQPGDDGVTVYLRPRDADGDVVKTPGRITIQLLDTTDPGSPKAVGVCVFDDPIELGRNWHSRFSTNHYTLECPFSSEVGPRGPKVTVSVEFLDYLSGSVLTAVKEVTVSLDDR